MKPKYKINQIVKIKATGEKVKIQKIREITPWIAPIHEYIYMCNETWYEEEQLKSFCPSRTGTRDPKTGRFVSKCMRAGWCELCREVHKNPLVDDSMEKWIKSIKNNTDSKQRNYQKILTRLEVVEMKIDKLIHETVYR